MSPGSIGQGLPSTTVVAPFPSMTKRSAFIEWRCGRAVSPGIRICRLKPSVRPEPRLRPDSNSAGLLSTSTRRSASLIEVASIAVSSKGSSVSQRQICGGSGGPLLVSSSSQSATTFAASIAS